MILNELIIKNFRSFGNNTNVIKFNTTEGELNLIIGKNGSGKTSIINSIDFNLHKKVKGRDKNIKISSLPNRINKNLYTKLSFVTDNNEYLEVIRGLEPNIFKIYKNNEELFPDSSYELKQNKLDTYINFDYDSWKSYISLSVNDFKDFLSLNKDDKKLLLEKLLNINLLLNINSHLKEKHKDLSNKIDIINNSLNIIKKTINDYKQIIKTAETNSKDDVDKLKNEILSKKDIYISMNNSLIEYNKHINTLNTEIREIENKRNNIRYEIGSVQDKLKLYNNDICPLCNSRLNTDTLQSYKNELLVSKEELEKSISSYSDMIKICKEKLSILETEQKELNINFTNLKIELSTKQKQIQNYKPVDTKNLEDTIQSFKPEFLDKKEEVSKIQDELSIINKSIDIFNNKNLKNRITKTLIEPLNDYITEVLNDFGIEYRVILNESFDATISIMGDVVDDIEQLSNGEIKKINIAIMLSYLRLIRNNRFVNILFLDEVFSSIDIDGIYDILIFLRKFAKKHKINIYLIHHAILDESFFDNIIKITKNNTSEIEKIK